MKYRMVKKRELYYWEFGSYRARDCWDVQKRFLFFFWITIKGFWDEPLAKSYLDALNELEK
jgi:hypothetical protein